MKGVFIKINGYPSKLVNKTLWLTKETLSKERNLITNIQNENMATSVKEKESFHHMCLPYKGKEGETVMKKLKSQLQNVLPKSIKPRIIYKGKKLGSFFSLKDQVKKEHLSELVYGFQEQPNSNKTSYIGETNVRIGSRSSEHLKTDKKSAIFKHIQANNLVASANNFKIIESGFRNTIDRKLAEALYIKEYSPPLNEQVKSFKLCLFN